MNETARQATGPLIKRVALCGAIGFVVWWFVRDTDPYLRWLGLNGANTVYEYRTARVKAAVHWTMHMCNNGECLTERDWACGYENGPDNAVYECFEQLADRVPVWWRLDRLRKECGHRHMTYAGTYRNEKRCRDLGGPRTPSQPPW